MEIKEYLGDQTLVYPSGFEGLLTPCNWLTDGPVSFCFCKNGISNLDYHGKQPVSRNARMVVSSYQNPALQFGIRRNGEFLPFEIREYEAAPWASRFKVEAHDKTGGEMFAMAASKSLLMGVCLAENVDGFSLCFNTECLNTNVHGNMTWRQVETEEKTAVFCGQNQTKLSDWVKEKGAFLVPTAMHARVFGLSSDVDVNNLDVLPPVAKSVLGSDELLFDSTCYLVLSGVNRFVMQQENERLFLDFGPLCNGEWLYFAVSFGDELDAALAESERIKSDFRLSAEKQSSRYQKLMDNQPTLTVEGYPQISEVFRRIPQYIEAAKQPDTGMLRASASSYYWVWGWDSLVTAAELSKWGDTEGQRKIIRFFLSHRWKDGSVPHRYDRNYNIIQTMQFGSAESLLAALIYQHYSDTKDLAFLRESYPALLEMWRGLNRKADKRGFIRGLGFYPDNPRALGRTQNGFAAMETGTYYFSARIIGQVAYLLKDEETWKQAEQTAETITQNYLRCFFNPEAGALADSIDPTDNQSGIYPLYAYMAVHNRFGQELLAPVLNRCAAFFVENYFTDNGIRTLSKGDSHAKSESIHHAWYPHWDIYAMKIIRLGGEEGEIEKILPRYLDLVSGMWNRYRAVMELVELDTADPDFGWKQHGQAWNGNCASGLYRTLIESVVGVLTDCGSITLMPPVSGIRANLDGLSTCGGQWNIRHVGSGGFSHLRIDGTDVYKTLKVPKEFLTCGSHTIEVIYGPSEDKPD